MTKIVQILVLGAALALAGCGSSSGGRDDDARGVDTGNTVYQAAHGICSSASPEELRANYRTPSDKPDAIAQAIATNLAGGIPDDEEAARRGCLDGLKAYEAAQ